MYILVILIDLFSVDIVLYIYIYSHNNFSFYCINLDLKKCL